MLKASGIIKRKTMQVNGSNDKKEFLCSRISRCKTVAIVVALAIAMLYLPGCNRSERKAEALYREARQHVREQQLDDALALYAKIVDEHPRTDAARRAAEELDVYRNLRRAVTEYPGHKARDLLVETARAIEVFRVRRGAWPRSLDKLKPGLLSQSPIDPWGRVLRYETKKGKNGYRLACLGSDGKVGGTGDASDWLIEDGVLVRHP